jgi:hypothetical protein
MLCVWHLILLFRIHQVTTVTVVTTVSKGTLVAKVTWGFCRGNFPPNHAKVHVCKSSIKVSISFGRSESKLKCVHKFW